MDGGKVLAEFDSGILTSDQHRDEIVSIVSGHEAALFRFLVVFTGNREVARDCLQETFVRAYEHLRRGKTVNTQWLYRVARNRAIDEVRRFRRENGDTALLEDIQAPATREDMTSLAAALASLAPNDRAILALSAVEGLTGEEIATRLGIRHAAVRTRLHRARERFRRLYEGGPT